MANPTEGKHPSRNFNKARLQGPVFILMMILPFLIYLAAQSGEQLLIKVLLGILALVMIAIIRIC